VNYFHFSEDMAQYIAKFLTDKGGGDDDDDDDNSHLLSDGYVDLVEVTNLW